MKINNKKTIVVLLSMLLEKEYSKSEIIEKLNIKEPTFYTYIHQIKLAGFLVINKKENYKILKFEQKNVYSNKEINIIAYLICLSDNYLSKNKAKQFKIVLREILQLSDSSCYFKIKKQYEFFSNSIFDKVSKSKIEEFQNFIDKKQNLKITLKNNICHNISPIELVWKKDILHIKAINQKNCNIQTFSINDMVKYEILDAENENFENISETIFELSGRLAPIYILKENERMVESYKDRIIIANSENNKNNLFKRLLKYDISCKVLFPKQDVEKFKDFIKKSIENIA